MGSEMCIRDRPDDVRNREQQSEEDSQAGPAQVVCDDDADRVRLHPGDYEGTARRSRFALSRSRDATEAALGDYLTFRRMITPVFIQIIFWIAVIGIVIAGLVQISNGKTAAGILLLLLGPLGVRIYAEILIVIFRMNESLLDIRNAKLGSAAPPATAPPA